VALLGGIETGGTTWELVVGSGPADLRAHASIPTTSPGETMAAALAFLREAGPVEAVGIGSFGPVDVRPGSPTWGWITTTPKPGWANTDLAGAIGGALGVPVAFDTDANAAALGEHRWGAAAGLDTFAYVTVGTGIGGGGMARSRLLHGLVHPEVGHLRIPRDPDDGFEGACPYHGDCWEGLAAAPALEARWGRQPHELPAADEIWSLEARYLALGLVAIVAVLSPQAIVLGGGVLAREGLRERVRSEVDRLLAGYLVTPPIVAPALAPRSGVLGALALAGNATGPAEPAP
jgi:fructokinase